MIQASALKEDQPSPLQLAQAYTIQAHAIDNNSALSTQPVKYYIEMGLNQVKDHPPLVAILSKLNPDKRKKRILFEKNRKADPTRYYRNHDSDQAYGLPNIQKLDHPALTTTEEKPHKTHRGGRKTKSNSKDTAGSINILDMQIALKKQQKKELKKQKQTISEMLTKPVTAKKPETVKAMTQSSQPLHVETGEKTIGTAKPANTSFATLICKKGLFALAATTLTTAVTSCIYYYKNKP